jgi:hypothetical protein
MYAYTRLRAIISSNLLLTNTQCYDNEYLEALIEVSKLFMKVSSNQQLVLDKTLVAAASVKKTPRLYFLIVD